MTDSPRKRPFLLSLFFGALVLPATFLLAGCHPSRNNSKPAEVFPAPVSVGVSHPSIMDFPIIVRLPGTILPYQTADINAQVTGYLKSVRVDIGDRVRKGDILADISVPELTNHFVKSLADFQYHLILLERYRKTLLSSPDLVSTEEVDLARNKYLVSLAELRKLVSELQFSVIRAPFSGIITRRYMDPGALVGPLRSGNKTPPALFRLDDLRKVRVVMDIPQRYVNDIRKGTPATLVIPGNTDHPARGEVALISHALNPDSKTMPVQAIFQNPDGLLKPGMFIRIRLFVRKISGALTIPDKALLTRNSLTFVYVVDKRGTVQERRIEAGEDNGTNVEILKGLVLGDLVVVSGKHQVLPGDHPVIHPAMTQEELKEESPT